MNDVQLTTLLFLRRGDEILLAMKKRGFGQGRWNGVGGKVERGESPQTAAIRETEEEIVVTPCVIVHTAELTFHYAAKRNKPLKTVRCEVYTCDTWKGQPTETDEMAPRWFAIDEIPYERMWADDSYWLPRVLAGEHVEAEFSFDAEDNLTAHELKLIE